MPAKKTIILHVTFADGMNKSQAAKILSDFPGEIDVLKINDRRPEVIVATRTSRLDDVTSAFINTPGVENVGPV